MQNVLVIGGGSAGVGAAWRAALCGAKVTLVESGGMLGGTSTLGGVHCWEPGIASANLNRFLYRRMSANPMAAGCGRTLSHTAASKMGLNGLMQGLAYENTLRRCGAKFPARVHFEPEALHAAMLETLLEAGVRVWHNALVEDIMRDGSRLTGALVRDCVTGEQARIPFDGAIDCTGDAVVCRMAGVKTKFGEESGAEYGEMSAPAQPGGEVNGVSLIFRTTPSAQPRASVIPEWIKDTGAEQWIRAQGVPHSHVTIYPNGDRCYNPCPLMSGKEYWALRPAERRRECLARVWVLWDHYQNACEGHMGWKISQISPRVGVRESWRVQAARILTENDIRAGKIDEESIALADHVLVIHGPRRVENWEFSGPYGIPMGSLVTMEYENLLVAGRCAGFSHIAASSCRLSRTMMDLGEAAGAAAALSKDSWHIDIPAVRERLGFAQYLDWVGRVYPLIGQEEGMAECNYT